MSDELHKKPLSAEAVQIMSRMRVPMFHAADGNSYITINYWQNAPELHKKVVTAVLTELHKQEASHD